MKLFDREPIAGMFIFGLMLSQVIAQNPSSSGGGALISFADSLHSRGVETSRPSLIAALRNSDPEIRSLAALKLSEDHDLDAAPAIESALSLEKNLRARIDIASALWTLQDPKGLSSLNTMCSDPSLPINIIVDVVQKLSMIHESSGACIATVLGFVDSHRDRDSRSRVLPALPDIYNSASPQQAEHILGALEAMLQDKAPFVRMEASHALAQIGGSESAEAIHKAISREGDSTVRTSLERDLSNVERRP
jgi:HEAT repeat protein